MSNSVTLGWFGVLKNQITAQQFLLFILIWSISIILAIFSKFPNLVVSFLSKFVIILFYLILNFEIYFI